MAPIFEYIHKKGLRPIIWADILLSYPEMLGRLPGYVTPMDWDYWTYQERPPSILAWGEGNPTLSWNDYPQKAPKGFADFFESYAVDSQTHRDGSFRTFFYTDALADRGFEVLTAPASRCAGDMYGVGHLAMHMPNCFYFTRKGFETGSGTLVTSWAVRHTHPEICQLASYAASLAVDPQRSYSFDEIADAYTEAYYGEKLRSFAAAVKMAERQFAPGLARVPKLDFRLSSSKSRRDPLAEYIELMEEIHRGRGAAVEYLEDLIAGYREAKEIFKDLKQRAHRNSENLDFWIEAVDVDTVQAETLLAAMKGEIDSRAHGLLKKIKGLKASAGNLFASTYEEWSIEDELQI